MKGFGKKFSKKAKARDDDRAEIRLSEKEEIAQHLTLEVKPVVIDMALSVWRLKQRLLIFSRGQAKEECRPLIRQVESIWDSLRAAGVEMQDHTNEPFDSGQSLEVLAFQPTAGVTREIVAETIKPTIYVKGHCVQMGQVIVATPESKN